MSTPPFQRMDGPSKNVYVTGADEDAQIPVVTTGDNRLNTFSDQMTALCETQQQILDELKLMNAILGEIGK